MVERPRKLHQWIILSALLGFPWSLQGQATRQAPPESQIMTTGEVEITAPAGSATIFVALQGVAPDAPGAADSVLARWEGIEAGLAESFGSELTVRPTGFGLGENQEVRRQVRDPAIRTSEDFLAHQGVEVFVPNPEVVQEVIITLLNLGKTRILGVTYSLDPMGPEALDALERAMVAARGRAEAMARGLGGSLGRVINARDQTRPRPSYSPFTQLSNTLAATGVQIPNQQVVATASVAVTWEFIPGGA